MTETIKISNLPPSGVLDGTERVPVVKAGVTRITTTQQIGNLFGGVGRSTAGYLLQANGVDADPTWVGFTQAGSGAVTRTWQAKVRDVVSVKDFGAVGDGTTDDTDALAAAFAASPGCVVTFPLGTYRITESITVTNDIIIDLGGSTIDGSDIPAGAGLNDVAAIFFEGAIGAASNLTANVTAGDTQVSIASTADFAAGDYVQIQDNQRYSSGAASGGNLRGWVTRVTSVASGTVLEVADAAPLALLTASTARVSKITSVCVTVSNGTVVMGGVGSVHCGLSATYTENAAFEGVTVIGAEDVGLRVSNSYRPAITGCSVYDSTSPDPLVGTTGYGAAIFDGTMHATIENCRFENCRHAVSGGGVLTVFYANIINNAAINCGLNTPAFDCHEPCFYWRFIGNTTTGGPDGFGGFVIRGQFCEVSRNTIVNTGSAGIWVRSFIVNSDGVSGFKASDNTIVGGEALYSIYLDGTDGTIIGAEVSNNTIKSSYQGGIVLNKVHDTLLADNIIDGATNSSGTEGNLIRLVGTTSGDNARITIAGGRLKNAAASRDAIYARFVDDLTVSDVGVSAVRNALNIASSPRLSVARITGASTATFLYLDACASADIEGCIATISGSAVSDDMVRAFCTSGSSTGLHVANCRAYGTYRRGVYSTSYDECYVENCDFVDAANSIPIELTGITIGRASGNALNTTTAGPSDFPVTVAGTRIMAVNANGVRLESGKGLLTGTTSGNTALLRAYNVGGASYTTFATLTADTATPTMDLSDSVTKSGGYIYRAGGTDVPLTDGGTGASTAQAACANLSTWYVVAASAVAIPHTGTTTQTVLATIPISAGIIGANGILRVTTVWSVTNSGNAKTLSVRFGASGAGTGGTAFTARSVTTVTGTRMQTQIANVNSASSQSGYTTNADGFATTTGGVPTTAAINTAAASELAICATLADSGETITLQSYVVELASRS